MLKNKLISVEIISPLIPDHWQSLSLLPSVYFYYKNIYSTVIYEA